MNESYKHALHFAAQAAIEWRSEITAHPVAATDNYTTALKRFGTTLPTQGLAAEQVLAQLVDNAEPGLCSYVHPRFLGWVVGSSHPVGVAADWLTQAWGQNAPIASVTPAAAAAEEVAGNWIKSALGLPGEAEIGFTTGATMANTICLAAARNSLLERAGWDVESQGLFGAPEVQVVLGEEAHASVYMALQLLGFGAARVHRVPVDTQGRMSVSHCTVLMEALPDPILLIAQAGHINSGDFDPFAQLATLTAKRHAWLHVDAAFGIWVRLSRLRASRLEGVELADSWAVDAHKWLQVPYDSGLALVRDKAALTRAMSMSGSYLAHSDCRDPIATTPELSRRARGFAVWSVLRHLGREGLCELVERFCKIAEGLARELQKIPGIQLANTVASNQVSFYCLTDGHSDDQRTEQLLKRLQASNVCYPSDAIWQGRRIIRMSICAGDIQREDVAIIAQAVAQAVAQLQPHGS
ncbi:MAG: pyridoxal phosphate-dependent decarboxylase family protein [Pseudomonadales bacterium]